MLFLLLILTAAFAILSWSNLHRGLWLLAAVLPSYLLRTEIFGVPTTLLELLVVAYLVVWFLKNRNHVRHLFPLASSLLPLALLLISTLSIFTAPDFLSALGAWKAYFLEPIALFFIVTYELKHGGLKGARLFEALGVCALFLSIIAIIQWLTGAGIPIPWDFERRVTSVFEYPNALGLFLGPIVIIAFIRLCHPEKRSDEGSPRRVEILHFVQDDKKLFWLLVTVLSSIAIVLAQSEAAIVAVLATLALAGLTNRKTKYTTIVACFVIAISILLSPWRATITDKLTLRDYSGQVRLSQWSETVDLLRDRWFLGAGLSGYPTVFAPYHKATHLEIFQYPHNIFLNIWVELGLLGLAAFALLAYYVSLSRQTLSTRSLDKGLLRRLAPRNDKQWTAFFALLQMSIHGLVDVPYFKNDLAILTWILLAIVLTYARPSTPPTTS